MRLVSTEFGQAFQQLVTDEVRPLSGLHGPDLYRGLINRYDFATAPTPEELSSQTVRFKDGRFLPTEGRPVAIRELTIYPDGIIVISFQTQDADAILSDAFAWAKDAFGLRDPITWFPRRFFSSVVVEFGSSIDPKFTILDSIRDRYASILRESYALDIAVEVTRLTLAADSTKVPPFTATDFTLERRTRRPFGENRYFSSAPLSTGAHIELLEEIERQLCE